jgi:hypothetical protein
MSDIDLSESFTHLPDIGQYLPDFRKFASGHVHDFVNARDRARYLLGNDQRYIVGAGREELLREFLRKVLPGGVSIDSGVVYGFERVPNSAQIDILIWDGTHFPPVFRADTFVILSPESVIAAISVKSTADHRDYTQTVDNLASLADLDLKFRSRANLPAIAKFGVFYDAPAVNTSAHAWTSEAIRHDLLARKELHPRIIELLEAVDPREPDKETTDFFDRLIPQLFVHLQADAITLGRGWGPPGVTVEAAAKREWKREPYLYMQQSQLTTSLEKLVYHVFAASLKAFGRFGGSLLSAWGDFDPLLHMRFGDAGELVEETGLPLVGPSDLASAG